MARPAIYAAALLAAAQGICVPAASAFPQQPSAASQEAGAPQQAAPQPAEAVPAEPARPPRREHRVAPAASEVVVDGVLDEAAWESATAIALPYEWFPADNAAAPVDTVALVTFDARRLYVAFRAADPEPAAIRAHFADRDDAFADDAVGFYLDTFDDRRRAFHFRVNPLGVQMEARVSDVEGETDWSWDALWDSAGRLTPEGYQVEIAVPFAQLRLPPNGAGGVHGGGVPARWGFLAVRELPRSVARRLASAWKDSGRDCTVCQFEPLTGVAGARDGLHLELDPTVTLGRTDVRDALPGGPLSGGPLVAGDEDAEAGLTARWGLAPNVTLGATVNPDFSQVEADAARLAVNERFALFFPERRPFFLEGAELFASPLDAVFTRTIADPSAGAKLTGKSGRHAYGLLLAEDEITNLLFPGYQGSQQTTLATSTRDGVARYRRDVGRTSSLGFLWTGRDGGGYSNHVAGVDGALRLTDADTVRFQLLGSTTAYPAAVAERFGQPVDRFDGHALLVNYTHGEREWAWVVRYEDLGEGFRADAGFLPRVGYRRASAGVERTFWGMPDGRTTRLVVYLGGDGTTDSSGEITEWGTDTSLTWEGPLQSWVSVNLAPNEEHYAGTDYKNFRQNVEAGFRPLPDLELSAGVNWGETIDFRHRRQADFVRVAAQAAFHLGRRLEGEVAAVREEYEVAPGPLYDANLVETRLIYHLTRRLFLRGIVQWSDVARNVAVWSGEPAAEDEELFTQLLASWKLNPRTVVLAGYSDTSLGGETALGESLALTRAERTFFLKLGYALLF